MSHRSIEQRQKEFSTLQTLAFLLELVEALVAIQDLGEKTTEKTDLFSPAITAGTSLARISSQILGYQYIGVFAIEQPDDVLCLLGVSGLTPEQEGRFRAATDRTPLPAYLDATAIRKLHANQVVVVDAKQHPLAASGVPFDARYLLVAPMVLHEQLIGLFVTAKKSTVARVSVRDEGPGLSPDEQARIWERFYRIPGIQAQYKSNDDLGLGLYLCRAIIEYHQGHVGVQSAPGKGTVFWFTLPLAPS